MRIAYGRDDSGVWREVPAPDPFKDGRPWFRRVKVAGPSAFFHHAGVEDGEVTIEFSQDLTCVIGGSMTGKSTLLDGLRVYLEAELPSDKRLEEDVRARGRNRFLAGQPQIELDTPGNTNAPPRKRWPAVFFTQNELHRLVREANAVRDILSQLVPAERQAIDQRDALIDDLDQSLQRRPEEIVRLLDELSEAEQRLLGGLEAQKALLDFKDAGLDDLRTAQRMLSEVERGATQARKMLELAESLVIGLKESAVEAETFGALREAAALMDPSATTQFEGLEALFPTAEASAKRIVQDITAWFEGLAVAARVAERVVLRYRQLVEKKLRTSATVPRSSRSSRHWELAPITLRAIRRHETISITDSRRQRRPLLKSTRNDRGLWLSSEQPSTGSARSSARGLVGESG